MGRINGCEIGAYRRLAKKCRECANKEYCKSKRIENEAYLIQMTKHGINFAMQNYGVTTESAAEAIVKALGKVGCIIEQNNTGSRGGYQ